MSCSYIKYATFNYLLVKGDSSQWFHRNQRYVASLLPPAL